jgi:predicted aspartyl protease
MEGQELIVLVVFAPEGMDPLLGATALETFGLAVDPINLRLVPVPALLK